VVVGREKTIRLYGPQGFIEHIQHKLHGYRWNLVDRYVSDLVFLATEIDCSLKIRTACFRLKKAFSQEATACSPSIEGVLYSGPIFRVSTAVLKHRTPCLAFAIEEAAHVNVWKNRLAELGLGVGPWLRELKRAVLENKPDNHMIQTGLGPPAMRELSLRTLRSALTVTPGQKVVYVTDAADTPENRAAIIRLAQNADLLFIEAAFAQADAALAAERAHLTTATAGNLARLAGVRRIEPFHFSARYTGQETRLLEEVMAAFAGISAISD